MPRSSIVYRLDVRCGIERDKGGGLRRMAPLAAKLLESIAMTCSGG